MNKKFLKRYTNIPSLLHILTTKQITLLDPATWDDKNDSYGIKKHKDLKSLETVLALCFTEAAETYHHWRVYAGDSSGVCITFKKQLLIDALLKLTNVECRPVVYKTIQQFRDCPPTADELPFVKRSGYADESEFRVVYRNKTQKFASKKITIPLESIEKISLSPWVHKSLLGSLKETVTLIDGCSSLDRKIFRSSITENRSWKDLIDDIA